MGCWNTTCGLTHLPIQAGDPVRAAIIQSNSYATLESAAPLTCYIDDLYFPRTTCVRGKYDDYGGVESITGETELHRRIVVDNIRQDIKSKTDLKPSASLNEAFSLMNRDADLKKAKVGSGGTIERQNSVGIWMCHEGAYEAAIHSAKSWQGVDLQSLLALADKHVKCIPAWAKSYKGWLETLKKMNKTVAARHRTAELMAFALDDNGGLHGWLRGRAPYGYHGLQSYTTWIVRNMAAGKKFDADEVRAVVIGLAEMAVLMMAMTYGRIGFMPPCTSGGQDSTRGVQRALAEFVLQYRGRYEEEEDDE